MFNCSWQCCFAVLHQHVVEWPWLTVCDFVYCSRQAPAAAAGSTKVPHSMQQPQHSAHDGSGSGSNIDSRSVLHIAATAHSWVAAAVACLLGLPLGDLHEQKQSKGSQHGRCRSGYSCVLFAASIKRGMGLPALLLDLCRLLLHRNTQTCSSSSSQFRLPGRSLPAGCSNCTQSSRQAPAAAAGSTKVPHSMQPPQQQLQHTTAAAAVTAALLDTLQPQHTAWLLQLCLPVGVATW
jgi:hypothetical protein